MSEEEAKTALQNLLRELPWEFSYMPEKDAPTRQEFRVIKKSNVRKVHESLWKLQEYFGLQ